MNVHAIAGLWADRLLGHTSGWEGPCASVSLCEAGKPYLLVLQGVWARDGSPWTVSEPSCRFPRLYVQAVLQHQQYYSFRVCALCVCYDALVDSSLMAWAACSSKEKTHRLQAGICGKQSPSIQAAGWGLLVSSAAPLAAVLMQMQRRAP